MDTVKTDSVSAVVDKPASAAVVDKPLDKDVLYDKNKPVAADPAPPLDAKSVTTDKSTTADPAADSSTVPGSIATGKTDDKPDEDVAAAPTEELKKEDLKLPDGAVFDDAHVNDLVEFAKKNKLAKDQAQALLDRDQALAKNARQAGSEEFQLKQQEAVRNNSVQWFKEAQSDKEFGGANFNKNAEKVHRVIQEFFPVGAKEILEKTGLGNNIAVLSGFKKIADLVGEDHLRKGVLKSSGSNRKEDKAVFFPSMQKQ